MADYYMRGEMTLSTGQFISSAKAASESLNRLNGSAGKAGAGVNMLGSIMKKVALGAMAGYIVKLGVDSVRAAQTAGAAQTRLASLLRITNGATDEQIAILNQQASALEQMTVVAKDNITVVQSQLATFDLGSKAIATLTPAILDYVVAEKGAAAGADQFKQMTNGLALALSGQFGALTRVGFVLDKQTKDQIKNGTEMQRAEAIVKVLNSTYKDFAKTAGDTAAGAQQKLGVQVNNLKQSFGEALLPTIMKVQGFMATKLLPVINGLMAKFKDGSAINKMISFFGNLLKNLYDFVSAIAEAVAPVFMNVLVPALLAVGAAVVGVIKFLGMIGRFIKDNMEAVQAFAQVLAAAAIGYGVYKAAALSSLAVTKLHALWTKYSALATAKFTAAQRLLNLTMAFNPVSLIVGALVALVGIFIVAWNHSERFRKAVIAVGKAGLMAFAFMIPIVGKLYEIIAKVVTGPMRGLLAVLAKLKVPGTQAALDFINKGIDGIGDAADWAAGKVKEFAGKLDGLVDKKIKLPDLFNFKMPKGDGKIAMPDISGLDPGSMDEGVDKKAEELAAKLADLRRKLKEQVQTYNDFINNDFAAGFVKGSETARDTILKGLDELKKVFDAQRDILEAQDNRAGMAKIDAEFDKVNNLLRSKVADAMAVAGELEAVEKKLEDAYNKLKDVVQTRSEGAKAFAEAIRKPLGEPSDIDKAFNSADATVDSILSMYDKLRDALDKRFTEIGGSKKNELINLLTDQTTKLVSLAKKREEAAKALKEAQKDLEEVLQKQESFKSSISDSIKSFGSALADLSKTNADYTIKVIKTATGLVVTQMGKGTSGVETIIDKLKTSLKTIKEFTTNIQALLTQGYNKEYVRTLLEAGPEAAGATAALLAKSGSDTMATINELYSSITSTSENFGTKMSETFYGNSVSMAKALVAGAESEIKSITDEMTKISDSITAAFAPLADLGTNVGNDIIQDMINALEKRRQELIDKANAIAAEIAAAMAAAAANIGVTVSSAITPNPTGTTSGTTSGTTGTTDTTGTTGTTTTQAQATTSAATSAAKAASTLSKYVVKSGDTLSKIAKDNGTTVKAILAANPKFTEDAKYKGGNMIWSGTTVKIPTVAPTSAPTFGAGSGVNTNTLAGITQASNITVEKGAVQVDIKSNVPASDIEPIMTRALVNALSGRER